MPTTLSDRILSLLSQGQSLNSIALATGASANLISQVAQSYTSSAYSVTNLQQRAFDLLSAGHPAEDVAALTGLGANVVAQIGASLTLTPTSGFGPGSGGGGGSSGQTALTPTAVQSSSYSATANQLVPVDASGGAITVTLPAAPADQSRVAVKIVAQATTPNVVTLARAGSDVFNKAGGSTSLTYTALNTAVTVQYQASTGIWFVLSTDAPLGQKGGAAQLDTTAGTLAAAQIPASVVTGISPSGDTTGATDTATIQAAINAADTAFLASATQKAVLLTGGLFWTTGLTMKPGVSLEGIGKGGTILKLANGANVDVIAGLNFATLTGTGTVGTGTGCYDFAIRKLAIDGNRANNTSGFGIRVYGYDFDLSDLSIRSCAQDGLFTEFGPLSNETPDSMESLYSRLKIHDNGGWGWHDRGPQDSMAANLTIYNNNQAAGTGGGLWVEDDRSANKYLAGALQLVNSHIWGSSQNWGIINDSSLYGSNVEVEGASYGQILDRGQLVWRGGKVFFANTFNVIGVQLGDDGATPGTPSSFAFTSGSNEIDMRMSGFFGSGRNGAPVAWVSGNTSSVRAHVSMANTPAALASAISGGNVGTQIGSLATLTLASTAGMPANNGQVTIPTSGGTATLSYSSMTGSTLNGIAIVSGTTTWTVSAGSATLVMNAISGAYDTGSRVEIAATHPSATAAQRSAWSVYNHGGSRRFDVGSAGSSVFNVTSNGTDFFNINATNARVEIPAGNAFRNYITSYNDWAGLDGKGHVIAPNATAPTFGNNNASATAAGTNGASDLAGEVTCTGPSSPPAAPANLFTVTYANALPRAPKAIVIAPRNAASAACQPYVSVKSTTLFTVGYLTAPSASAALSFDYLVIV